MVISTITKLGVFKQKSEKRGRILIEGDRLQIDATPFIALGATSRQLDSRIAILLTPTPTVKILKERRARRATFSPFGSNWNVLRNGILERERYDPLNMSHGLRVLWYSLARPLILIAVKEESLSIAGWV